MQLTGRALEAYNVVAPRVERAANALIDKIKKAGGLTEEEAQLAADRLLDADLVRVDPSTGQIGILKRALDPKFLRQLVRGG